MKTTASQSEKKSPAESRNKFYENMKNNIHDISGEIEIDKYVAARDKKASMAQIKSFDEIVVKSTARVIKSHCFLGLELANLKYMYYVEFCPKCRDSDNIYDALFCNSCPHLPSNSAGIKEFFKFCKDNLQKFSVPWINFLVRVGKLSEDHPKFIGVNISIHDLKRHISWLSFYMEKDSVFWN
jgi:hypothetical protein